MTQSVIRGVPVTTTPTIVTATSTVILAANDFRQKLEIQNCSAANIMINLEGATLTGIVPTATNKGFVLEPGRAWYNDTNYIPTSDITCYQTSGGNINTVVVVEG